MICSYCFRDEKIQTYIIANGSKANKNHLCEECQTVNEEDLITEMYLIQKSDLADRLRMVITNLYSHENQHGLYGSARAFAEGDEEPNDYAGCSSLSDVCWDLFNEGEKLPSLLIETQNWKDIADGCDASEFDDEYSNVWKGKCFFEQDSFDWDNFSKKIKHSLRFFDTDEFNRVDELEKLNRLFEILSEHITSEDIAYRARGIKTYQLEKIRSNPSEELGQAPEQFAGHNRFSPSGISYIYLAYDEKTGISEVYDVDKDLYAVGKFSLENDLRLLNLKQDNFERLSTTYTNPFDDRFESYFNCSIGALQLFIKSIQQPINNDEKSLEYLPTQILAEYIRLQGYDGFIFDSTKNDDGVNIVLFENKINYIDFQEKQASIKIELEDN